MANNLQESVIETLIPMLDANGTMPLQQALEALETLNLPDGAAPIDALREMPEFFDIDPEEGSLHFNTPAAEESDDAEEDDDMDDNSKKYPIPPVDFKFNGQIIKLMNSLYDENTPREGLYFAQFAKAAKDHNLAIPPHEEKLLLYLKLYPKIFEITVDPIASQKIYIRPVKGFKKIFKKDYKKNSASDRNGSGNSFQPKQQFTPGGAQRQAAPHSVPERKLSLYSLADFAYFPNIVEALKKLHEMASETSGCFLIEDSADPNPYRMYWNKLEHDFAEAIRREINDEEALFLMSPVGADFPTQFTTADGARIYASFVFNALRNDRVYQAWKFSDFYADNQV